MIVCQIKEEMKAKKKNSVLEQVKASRKQSREEEIKMHGKAIYYSKIKESRKVFNRKKNKADADEALPYLLTYKLKGVKKNYIYQILTLFSGFTYILFSGLTLKASYQAAICGKAPFTRHSPSECGSDLVRTRISSGRIFCAQTFA